MNMKYAALLVVATIGAVSGSAVATKAVTCDECQAAAADLTAHLLGEESLAEQVAIVYAGVKGLIDDVPVDKVVDFSRELREYLKSNKAEFITEIQEKKVMSPEAEAILKDAITEVVSTMVASAA